MSVSEMTPVGAANGAFEPTLIGFTCNWCSYRAADLAGTSRIKYPPNIRLIRLMCSGRLDPTFVLKAMAEGADGVLITGCWPGDCHYLVQNHYAQRRFLLLKRTLVQFGIEPERIKLVWASAAEGMRLASEIAEFTEEVRALGPLSWPAPEARPTIDPLESWRAAFGGEPDDAPAGALEPESAPVLVSAGEALQ
jgi:F420-non-reducing hydrogenase iron-sulfur subunit